MKPIDKDMLKEAGDAVKRFNSKPPAWFYWVIGFVIIVLIQALRFI